MNISCCVCTCYPHTNKIFGEINVIKKKKKVELFVAPSFNVGLVQLWAKNSCLSKVRLGCSLFEGLKELRRESSGEETVFVSAGFCSVSTEPSGRWLFLKSVWSGNWSPLLSSKPISWPWNYRSIISCCLPLSLLHSLMIKLFSEESGSNTAVKEVRWSGWWLCRTGHTPVEKFSFLSTLWAHTFLWAS